MQRTLCLLDQIGDVIEAEARPQPAHIAGLDLERYPRRRRDRAREAAPKRVVDDGAERATGTAHKGGELRGHIVIKGDGGPHALMLRRKHHDVN